MQDEVTLRPADEQHLTVIERIMTDPEVMGPFTG